jgi:hypothetical protein
MSTSTTSLVPTTVLNGWTAVCNARPSFSSAGRYKDDTDERIIEITHNDGSTITVTHAFFGTDTTANTLYTHDCHDANYNHFEMILYCDGQSQNCFGALSTLRIYTLASRASAINEAIGAFLPINLQRIINSCLSRSGAQAMNTALPGRQPSTAAQGNNGANGNGVSQTAVSTTSAYSPRLSGMPTVIIRRILELNRTSALTLGVAHRAFTNEARSALQRSADEICREWSGNTSLLWSAICDRGCIVTHYQLTQLTEDDVQVRSRAAVVFHASIVSQINKIGVHDYSDPVILSSSQLVRFSAEMNARAFHSNVTISLPDHIFERLSALEIRHLMGDQPLVAAPGSRMLLGSTARNSSAGSEEPANDGAVESPKEDYYTFF